MPSVAAKSSEPEHQPAASLNAGTMSAWIFRLFSHFLLICKSVVVNSSQDKSNFTSTAPSVMIFQS